MLKKRVILYLSIIVLLISLVYASTSVKYTYSGISGISAVVYDSSNQQKQNLNCVPINCYSGDSGNTITIDYPSPTPSSTYYTFHYKDKYLPYMLTRNSDSGITPIKKQSNCKANIKTLNFPSTLNKGIPFAVTLELNDATTIFTDINFWNFIPTDLNNLYNVDTQVKLFIDSNTLPYDSKSIAIIKGTNQLIFDNVIINNIGSHNIKVETNIIDDQCDSSSISTNFLTQPITITSPQCPTCPLATQWLTCSINSTGQPSQNRTNYRCDSSTNYSCQDYVENQSCSLSCPSWSSGSWSDCYQNQTNQYLKNLTLFKTNSQCTDQLDKNVTYITCDPNNPSKCSDGTQNGMCSLTNNEKTGQKCVDGNLVDDCNRCGCSSNKICLKNDKCTSCIPNWQIGTWSSCKDSQKIRTVKDLNSCNNDYSGTTYAKPETEVYCDETSTQTTNTNTDMGSDIYVPAQTNKFEFDIGSGIYWLIGLIVFSLGTLTLFLYFLNKPKVTPVKVPEKEILKKVNVTDLLKTTIDSLDEDGKAICNKLIEGEGIRQDSLRNILSIPKPRMEMALSRLERRQIIEERDGENPKIFFNEWLK